jgi:hypothetical protein
MKAELLISACIITASLLLASLMSGCQRGQTRPSVPRPDGAAVVAGHEAKDAVVLAEADRIDVLAPQARPHTEAQRAAVAAAPAAQIAALNAEWAAVVRALEAQVRALEVRVEALQDAELRAQVGAMRKGGFVLLAAAAALAFGRQISWAVLAGGGGFLLLAVAQLWHRVGSHPWFYPVLGAVVVAGLAGAGWAAVHAYRREVLAAKVAREADRMKRALTHIVPVVEDAKAALGAAWESTFKPKLSGPMEDDEKQLVREVRAEVAAQRIAEAA